MRETMSFNELREQLNKRRAELLVRLERIIQELRHEGGLPADFEEQATERENDEVLAGLDDASRTEIQQIQTTLQRLDAGQYGHCKDCHKPIDVALSAGTGQGFVIKTVHGTTLQRPVE
jgi:DnaK suppressor protein